MNNATLLSSLCLWTFLLGGVAVADQYSDDSDDQIRPVRCITLTHLKSTDVVDDMNILFNMRDGTIYRNELAHECPGLRLEDKFMYRYAIGQLCDLDLITVLNDTGFGFTRGPSCGLGKFHPISKERAKMLKENKPD